MYYIERNTITAATFLAGSVAEPSATETEWVSGAAVTKGQERIRSTLHRVFKAAVDIPAGVTTPPEDDPTKWQEMRSTDRYLPFGPVVRADKKLVYEGNALVSTTADIEYRTLQRYANAVAIFGMRGAEWEVDVYDKVGAGQVLAQHRAGSIRRPATSYYDYAYGQRYYQDRVLITGLPMFPAAEVRVRIKGTGDQVRSMSQCEIGKLRYLPGVLPGGVEYGITRDPKVFTVSKQEPNGNTSVLIYGSTYDMSGVVDLSAQQEDRALRQFRDLIGKGVAYVPSLDPGWEQSLGFCVLTSAPTSRENLVQSKAKFQMQGLPV
ncbi:MAG: hypothetical protein ACO1PM_08075 [Acidovorax sp.]